MENNTQEEVKILKQELEKLKEIPKISNSLAKSVANLFNTTDIMQHGAQLLLLKNALQEYDSIIEALNK